MSWLRLVRTACAPAAGGLAVAVLAGAGAAGSAVGLLAVSAWLISRAALHPPVLHLMVAIVAVRAFGIGRGVLRYVERLSGHDAALRVLGALRVRLFSHLEALSPAGLARFRRADLAQRLAADVDAVLDLLTRVVLPYAVAALVGVGSVVLVGAYSYPAGLALATGLVVVGVVIPVLQGRAARRADGRLAPLRGELAAGTADLLHGLPDLIAAGATGARLAALAATGEDLRRAERRSSAMAGLAAAVTVLSTGVCLLVGLVCGAVAVRSGALPGEMLAVIVLTPLAVFETAAGLPAAAQRLAAARASLRRLAEILATPVPVPMAGRVAPVAGPAAPLPVPVPVAPVSVPVPVAGPVGAVPVAGPVAAVPVPRGPHTLRLERVSAGWLPGRTVLHDVDLVLEPGARVALVGPSGSGKSTIAALLIRFLDPTSGRVTLDGVDLRQLDPGQLRRVVGYLPEDAYLFDSTIAANLRIGRPDASVDQMRDALARARLLDWVDSLPDGLATPVGEHGTEVSGGQRRRLALARALLADFEVLILDEPTEHLDDRTATALTRDLLRAAGDRTVLLITHRADVAAEVDRVVEIDGDQALVVSVRGSAGSQSSSRSMRNHVEDAVAGR